MNEEIEMIGVGSKVFEVTFGLNPEIWEQEESRLFVRAEKLSDITFPNIIGLWKDEMKQPFGLGEEDVISFKVEVV